MSKQTRLPSRQERRKEELRRREEERRLAARRKLTIQIAVVAVCAVVFALIGVFAFKALANHNAVSTPAAAATPTAAGNAGTTQPYAQVDNISCAANEQLTYHVHGHLTIYISGKQVQIPANIGIAPDGSCFYWLHTHDTTGVIHVEAPQQGTYTLGTFLHLWGSQFAQLQYPTQLNLTAGWQVYVNGQPYTGDFRTIALAPHALITMAYQSPGITPEKLYNWDGL